MDTPKLLAYFELPPGARVGKISTKTNIGRIEWSNKSPSGDCPFESLFSLLDASFLSQKK